MSCWCLVSHESFRRPSRITLSCFFHCSYPGVLFLLSSKFPPTPIYSMKDSNFAEQRHNAKRAFQSPSVPWRHKAQGLVPWVSPCDIQAPGGLGIFINLYSTPWASRVFMELHICTSIPLFSARPLSSVFELSLCLIEAAFSASTVPFI